ncbi:cell surface protein precursor, CscC family [Listeria floridensis FSL S10-1187]|uniref:Cell surface protein, CscC family n=1 Tax=Listeria floridensis FSL S10-1187 TaxID=1265817 RepID=A0ABN0RD10_9LIST|nr:hypothetical protein [Listeria floridensis]EUJ28480.1 cell surface protein precursor, CscC family [Listeria floridensis FSL S10-1187]
MNPYVKHLPGSLRAVDQDGNETGLDESFFTGEVLNLPFGDLTEKSGIKKIRFEARVNKVDMDQEVTEKSASVGKNLITNSDPIDFTIASNRPPVVELMDSGKIVGLETPNAPSIRIPGSWRDHDSGWVELYYQIDNGTPQKFLGKQENNPTNVNYNFNLYVKPETLELGKHRVNVYAMDAEGAKSNVDYVDLLVEGRLSFSEISDFEFGLQEIPTENTLIFANKNRGITISDTRGAGGSWSLKARLKKPLVSKEGNQLNGLVFVDEKGNSQPLDTENLIQIKSGETGTEKLQKIEWNEKQGLGIELLPSSYVGEYSGAVEWVLEDTP